MGWREQLEKALAASAETKSLLDSIDQQIEEGFGCDGTDDKLESVFLRGIANRFMYDVFRSLESTASRVESPIEAAFFYAAILAASDHGVNVFGFGDDHRLPLTLDTSYESIEVYPQAPVGDFRVDFLLTYRGVAPSEKSKSKEVAVRLIVECDGHDFHEKTKEQASADKARDRTLQSVGYTVFRFTGSDLWKDPLRCGVEAVKYLANTATKLGAY